MMNSKIGLGVVLLALVLTTHIFAQPRGMSVDERLRQLNETLELSEEQSAKIKGILENSQAEMQKIREMNEGDSDAVRGGMREMFEKSRVQIENVLTDEQKIKYGEMQKNRGKSRRRGEGRRMEDLKERLNLSEEQATQIAPILEESKAEMEAIRVNRDGGRRAMTRKMKESAEITDKKIEALLTADQIEAYRRYKKDMEKMRPDNARGRNW